MSVPQVWQSVQVDIHLSHEVPVTVKPFEQQELHATVTICPEFKIPHQAVTQK